MIKYFYSYFGHHKDMGFSGLFSVFLGFNIEIVSQINPDLGIQFNSKIMSSEEPGILNQIESSFIWKSLL